MRQRSRAAWVLLACVLCGVQAGAEEIGGRAHIVWPALGGTLYYKGTIEVALENLATEHFNSLLVRVEALPVAGGDSVGPITLWEGWSDVPVVPGGEGSAEGCAWVIWTDKRLGRAVLRVVWNYFPPGFRGGDFRIKVDVLVRGSDQRIWRWGQTNWHHVRLIPGDSPALAVALTRPAPQSEFGLGERVVVTGITASAALPIRLWLEVKKVGEPGGWTSVEQRTFNTPAFEISWDASRTALGRYQLRVSVVDSRGASAVSAPVDVVFVPRPLQVWLTQPQPGTQVTVGEVLVVRGQVLGAALPGRVVLETKPESPVAPWERVGEIPLQEAAFEFRWETSRLAPGAFSLRATATDAQGVSASSSELRMIVQKRKFEVRVAGKPADLAEVREREPVQFELETDSTWARFYWDFGDGKTSESRSPVQVYNKAGTYTVCVTAHADGSQQRGCVDLVVAARESVVATRRILGYPRPDCDGVAALVYLPPGAPPTSATPFPVRVELTIRVFEPITGLLLTEKIPRGWSATVTRETTDFRIEQLPAEKSALSWIVTAMGRRMEINAGTQFVLAYSLIPPAPTDYGFVDIEGHWDAQLGPDFTLTRRVQGDSRLHVVSRLHPFVALLYLRNGPDGQFELSPPGPNQVFILTPEQVRLAEELMLRGIPVPYANGALGPKDYLRLVAYFQADRPVLDCLTR